MVTHAQASRSELLRKEAPVLSEAGSTIGSLQIHNMGTVVGNIVNAMSAADGAAALIALGARVRIMGSGRDRLVSVEGGYQGWVDR